MFHSVNGDRRGAGRSKAAKKLSVTPDPSQVNKGDRGFSDHHEAKVFMIGSIKKQSS